MAHNGTHLCRTGIRIPSARTVAKFIIKSSLLLLSLNKVFPARNCCRKMHHCSLLALQPGLHKCECCLQACQKICRHMSWWINCIISKPIFKNSISACLKLSVFFFGNSFCVKSFSSFSSLSNITLFFIAIYFMTTKKNLMILGACGKLSFFYERHFSLK